MNAERIHRWDKSIAHRALIFGAMIEAVVIAPAVLSPWGHGGPEWLLGWLSVLLNLPGLLFAFLLLRNFRSNDGSFTVFFAAVFVVQTIIISYLLFVYLRWKKLKVAAL
jgi:hypothetical protein